MKRSLKAVIFDFGNVLTLSPRPWDVRAMARFSHLKEDTFLSLYREHRSEFDRGTITAYQYWARILQAGEPEVKPDESLIGTLLQLDIRSWTRINRPVLDWSRRLRRAGLSTAILSNMPREVLARILARLSWIGEFPVRLFSCDVGLIKPEAAIFELCLRQLDVPGPEALFLDDSPGNVEGARRVGIQGFLFRSFEETAAELLRRFDLPGLPIETAFQR